MTLNEEALSHFLNIARAGNRVSASSGERKARIIADAIIEHAPGLDREAIEGLAEFARVASASYSTAKKLLLGK